MYKLTVVFRQEIQYDMWQLYNQRALMCHFMKSEGKTNEDLMRFSINSQILSIIKHSYTDTLIIIAVRLR